ncbi:hypothetical protein ACJ41O_003595 [Fusarium nematophilum]
MPSLKKFDPDAILTDPDLGWVYRSMHELAKEFAILGQIETAKTLISLLLSQYSSEWLLQQIRPLKFAFAEAGQWPEQIPPEERTEEVLAKIVETFAPDDGSDSDAVEDDPSELGVLLMTAKGCDASTGGAAMERSKALADALALAIRLASKNTSSVGEIEADPNVQKALGLISPRLHTNRAIEYLTQRRENWRLLTAGALARKIPLDMEKLEALSKEAVATFTERVKNGRMTHVTEKMSMKELLEALEHSTKLRASGQYEEMGNEVPESLFVIPPATDEQISALERRLDVSLPDDYKEFFKISNGFGCTWNGYHLDTPLFSVDKVDWKEIYMETLPLELHECISGCMDLELPDGREWPGQGQPLDIGSEDVLSALFITPNATKKALEAYKEVMESPKTPEDMKRHVRNLIVSRYGSWEAFEKLEWVAMESHDAEDETCGTFTQFLQARVRKSGMSVWEGEGEKEAGSISYRCMADRPEPDESKRRKLE